jgi:formate hydrogenlyase subunit 3/multisubunit Na+/H+ antiporter MnhD subunit
MTAFAIFVPFVAACLAFFSKRLAWAVAMLASISVSVVSILIFTGHNVDFISMGFSTNIFNSGMFMAAAFFTVLVVVYSKAFIKGHLERENEYYSYILISIGSCAGVFFSNDFLSLLLYWDILAAMLYMLLGISGGQNIAAKALLIVGSSDVLMIVGIGIALALTRTLQIGLFPIPIDGMLPWLGFICLCAGAFAKAGAFPLHTWIPDAAVTAPVPVMAFLPAALDKLVGIYFLFRVVTEVFVIQPGSNASVLLMAIGSLTIIYAVMNALMQHNIKKLLAYHAISQVGYMIIGIGCANPIGIAGGLFHMLNNAIYKTALFFSAGSVERSTGTTDVDSLGGLSKTMPFTFIATLIAAFSFSGVPPFNGFFSKWMIYQGIVNTASTNNLWIIWLTAAMFGSALTLASFIKLLYSVFLGQP